MRHLFRWWTGMPGPDTQGPDHGERMTLGRLRELTADLPDDTPVMVVLDEPGLLHRGIVTNVVVDRHGELMVGQWHGDS